MRIGFDLRPFLKEETGVGTYYRNLLFHLAQIDKGNEYFLFSSSLKDRFPAEKIPAFAKMKFRHFPFPVKATNFFWYRLGWPPLDYLFKQQLDLSHSPNPLILPTKGKKVITVHDLFFMDFPQKAEREVKKIFVHKIRDSLQRADGVIAVSQFTKDDIRDKFGLESEKVRVIYHGMDQKFQEEIDAQELERTRQKFSLPPSFILFVGTLEPRKNLLYLVDALKMIHEDYQKILLLIIGREGQDSRNLRGRIKQKKLESWVKFTGYLPEKDLKSIYRLASAFVFPSFCEGFGLPLLEAMASGLPIAASRAPAIPEIAQEAALYFRPEDPEDMAEKIIRLLVDETLRQSLRSEGKKRILDFDWKKAAAETLHFYQELVGKE